MTKSKKASARAKKNNMAGRKIKGKGNYQTFNLRGIASKLDQVLGAIPKGTFARKGAQMGAKYGPLGALAGKGIGAGIAAVTGYGNYSVRANSLSQVSTSVDMVPQFVKNDHSIRVRHREFIRDLAVPSNPTDFNLTSQLINPANKELFPWLATMAKQYSQYKVHGMVFVYKTMSSDITAGGSLGTVIFGTNYNSIDRSFLSKVEMENSEFAVSCKPSNSLVHAIECDPKYSGLDVLYVRDPAYETTDTSDRRFYDYGKFQVATQGLPGITGTTMGELWVSYDIEFMKPVIGGGAIVGKTILSSPSGALVVGPTSAITQIILRGAAAVPSTLFSPAPLSTGGIISGDIGLNGPVVTFSSLDVILRKNGRYVITYSGDAATGPTAYTLGEISGSQVIACVATNAGSATSLVYNYGILGPQVMPHAGTTAVAAVGLTYALQYVVLVNGITAATDTVTLRPSNFTVSSVNKVASVNRNVMIEWSVIGSNEQSQSYTVNAPVYPP